MKIGYASDIHTEWGNQRELTLSEPVDVLILAGDIGKGVRAIEYGASFLDQAKVVIQIAGNHEFWKGELRSTTQKMKAAAQEYPNLHFLENDSVEVDGLWFHGATAWTDFSYGGNQPLAMLEAGNSMNDYKYIKYFTGSFYRKLQPKDLLPINHKTKSFLFDAIADKGAQNSIVVTHHAPCHLSIPEKYKGETVNHCYVNTWGNDLAYSGPKLWFHGHLHDPSDYMVGETRVLCNPIGYPGQYDHSQIEIISV